MTVPGATQAFAPAAPPRARPIIAHVIVGLGVGGAEMGLLKVATALRDAFDSRIVSLTCGGALVQRVRAAGLPVYEVGLRAGFSGLLALRHLPSILRDINPDLVQTWMYHADLLGGVASKLSLGVPVVWNLQSGPLTPASAGWSSHVLRKVAAGLSAFLPDRIVACGPTSRSLHVDEGYDPDRTVVIPNTCDTAVFKRDQSARTAIRRSLGIDPDAEVVGTVARFHPQKDFATLLNATSILLEASQRLTFVFCGSGVDPGTPAFRDWISSHRAAAARVRLLGRRDDIPQILNALDLFVLSSGSGEGLPNVLLEAMASEIPAVSTSVGDSPWAIGDTGSLVPPGRPDLLADACLAFFRNGPSVRSELGRRARARVVSLFAVESVSAQYSDLYRSLLTPS